MRGPGEIYHGAQGCYFPETMTVWGTYSNGDYGWNRTGHKPKDVLCPYWQFAWNQGPELVALMLDRWDYTGDKTFLKEEVLPMAESVLRTSTPVSRRTPAERSSSIRRKRSKPTGPASSTTRRPRRA